MNAKQYLKQAKRLNELINSEIAELDQLKELSTSISGSSFESMPSGDRNPEPPFVRCVHKIIDLQAKINANIDRYVDLKNEIRERILSLDNQDYVLLLKERYLNFAGWEVIAENMHYTFQWVHELHKRALKAFAEKFNLEKT